MRAIPSPISRIVPVSAISMADSYPAISFLRTLVISSGRMFIVLLLGFGRLRRAPSRARARRGSPAAPRHPGPHGAEPGADASVHEDVPDADDHPADEGRVLHLVDDGRPARGLAHDGLDGGPRRRVRAPDRRDADVDAALLRVLQAVEVVDDVVEERLAALADEHDEESHDLLADPPLEGGREHPRLLGPVDAGGDEEPPRRRVGVEERHDGLQLLHDGAEPPLLLREEEDGFRVAPGGGFGLVQFLAAPVRFALTSARRRSARRRSSSAVTFRSRTLEETSRTSSTTSRRSASRTRFSSSPISFFARSRKASASAFALSSSRLR